MRDNVEEDKAPDVHSRTIDPIVVNLDRDLGSVPRLRPTLRLDPDRHAGFRIRVVGSEDDLALALRVRAGAYGRHRPDFATDLQGAEEADLAPGSIVLIAESASTGMADGTVRVQTNLVAPVEIERELDLPDRFRGVPLAQISRLGVRVGGGANTIKLALLKSIYLLCLANQVRWMLVAASPPMDRQYLALDFCDVFGDGRRVPLTSSSGLPLRIMAFEVATAERRWHERGNPLYQYMVETYSPELELFRTIQPGGLSLRPTDLRPRPSDTVGRREGPFGLPVV